MSAVPCILSNAGCLRLAGGGQSSTAATDVTQSQNDDIPLRVADTWGPASQRSVRWGNDRITVECGDTDPNETAVEDGTVDATVDIASGGIDMSELTRISYVYRHSSTPGTGVSRDAARQDVSYFGFVQDPNQIGQKSIEDDASDLEPNNPEIDFSLYIKDREGTGRVEREIETTGMDGVRHIGFGANAGSDTAQQITLEVFDIRGIDADGGTAFSLTSSEKYLAQA